MKNQQFDISFDFLSRFLKSLLEFYFECCVGRTTLVLCGIQREGAPQSGPLESLLGVNLKAVTGKVG
jgi:hypothetical protein